MKHSFPPSTVSALVGELLEEGILAIDREGRIIFLNAAAAQMLSLAPEAAMGRPLHSVYPSSTLDRICAPAAGVQREHEVPQGRAGAG